MHSDAQTLPGAPPVAPTAAADIFPTVLIDGAHAYALLYFLTELVIPVAFLPPFRFLGAPGVVGLLLDT
jgi:hypothetical protein